MKKWISGALMAGVLVGSSFTVSAQEHGGRPKSEVSKKESFEKIEAAKKEFFIKELALKDAESEKFWTVYSDYKKAARNARNEVDKAQRQLSTAIDSLTDKEAKSKMENVLSLENKAFQVKKDYLSKASSIVGYKKAVKSLDLDRKFKSELSKQLAPSKSSDVRKRGDFKKLDHKPHELRLEKGVEKKTDN